MPHASRLTPSLLAFLAKAKRRMVISTLILGVNRLFWASVPLGWLFVTFENSLLRILLVAVEFGALFVFLGLPLFKKRLEFFWGRRLEWGAPAPLLEKIIEKSNSSFPIPHSLSPIPRILFAALDFELYPSDESLELRNRTLADAEKLLAPLDPYCVIPRKSERRSFAVSLLLVLLGIGYGIWGMGDRERAAAPLPKEIVSHEKNNPQTPNPKPQIPIPHPPSPIPHSQLPLFLRTKQEFLSHLGKSHSRLTPEKQRLLDAMSKRQRTISAEQNDAVKQMMLENATLLAENKFGQSLQLQREILTALGLDPDKDYEKEGISPFVEIRREAGGGGPEEFVANSSELTESTSLAASTSVNGAEALPPSPIPNPQSPISPPSSAVSPDTATSEERYSGLWGELPENERQIGKTISQEQVIPEYQTAVDRYFQTLFRERSK